MTKSVNEREIVLAVLMEVTENGQFSHIVLRDVLSKYQYLEKRKRAFITRVTEGTLEHLIEIDYILDQFSKVKVKKMKPVIRNLLRSAVYQLKYMDSIPDRAVCSESVKLAVKKGFSGLRGFVNGVLRSVARGLEDVKYPTEEISALCVRYSCPEWIIRLWQKSYGTDVTEKMLKDSRTEKPTVIRCCLNRITPEELTDRLRKEGVTAEVHPYLPYALCISGYDYLEGLESFQEGLFMVQDISSMLAGELADPKAGDQIIDVCAAPGGKALHVAEKLWLAERDCAKEEDRVLKRTESSESEGTAGHVEARDLTEYKVELIEDNIARSGLANITAVCRDASVPDEEWREKADIVIADLPCSGLGVLGRKADLKYKASREGTDSLARLQKEILSCAKDLVRPGGALLYSTCTVNPSENIENVHWFLSEYPQFELDNIEGKLCDQLKAYVTEGGCIQLLPGVHKSDGFFIARFVKKSARTD